MKEKVTRWIAKKIKAKTNDVIIKSITVEYEYVNPATFELTPGKKTIYL